MHTEREVGLKRHRWLPWTALCLAAILSTLPIAPPPVRASLDEPPMYKWETWIPFQTEWSRIAVVLPEPIRGAGVAVLGWVRNPEGLYAPSVHLLDGTNGSVVDAYWGLPSVSSYSAVMADVDGDGETKEMIVTNTGGVLAIDLDDGSIVWSWTAPESLAGPAVLVPRAPPVILALSVFGSLYGLFATSGTLTWIDAGVGNRAQMSMPLLVDHDGHLGVVASHPTQRNASDVVVVGASLRYIDWDRRETLWTVPLRNEPLAAPVLARPQDGEPTIVFLDSDRGWWYGMGSRAFGMTPNGSGTWEREWDGYVVDDPFTLPVVDTTDGPVIVAPSWYAGRDTYLAVNASDGTARQIPTGCPGSAIGVFPYDFTKDGRAEVLSATWNGGICVHSLPAFELLWYSSTRTGYVGTPALGDIDGDGISEFVVVSWEGYVDAFDLPGVPPTNPPEPGDAILIGAIVVGGLSAVAAIVWYISRRRAKSGDSASKPQADRGASRETKRERPPGPQGPQAKV